MDTSTLAGRPKAVTRMHKSKLCGFIIDCKTDDLGAAAEFWSAALGMPFGHTAPDDRKYIRLDDPAHHLSVEVQQVDHASRVHLDIEADDVAAEVTRLEALGATRLQSVKDWVVMEAPTGQRFCVVPAATPHFDQLAKSWD